MIHLCHLVTMKIDEPIWCRSNAKKLQPPLPGSGLVSTEHSIMATFDFLANENADDDEEDEDDDGLANGDDQNDHDVTTTAQQLLAHANRVRVCFMVPCQELHGSSVVLNSLAFTAR